MKDTPLTRHGQLSVQGRELMDKDGKRICLYGMSTHGIGWYGEYVNEGAFRTLMEGWNTNCIRISLYPYEYNGYCTGGDRQGLMGLVKNAVGYADRLGMYIIIDWHVLNEQSPNVYLDEAKVFFEELSREYANRDNVLYEICNEPNRVSDWADIRAYANEIIPIIRSHTDAVIIVGTPTWSQEIDKPLLEPLEYTNIMYSLHFYAATHRDHLRELAVDCLEKGLPVFVSEFNITDAEGHGEPDFDEGGKWLELIDAYGLSHICWSLSCHKAPCSVIRSDCPKLSDWSDEELTPVGRWIKKHFESLAP